MTSHSYSSRSFVCCKIKVFRFWNQTIVFCFCFCHFQPLNDIQDKFNISETLLRICKAPQNILQEMICQLLKKLDFEKAIILFVKKNVILYLFLDPPGVPDNFWNLLQSYTIPQIKLQELNFFWFIRYTDSLRK